VGLLSLSLSRHNGWIAGRALASALPGPERGRAAAALLRDEQVVVRFEREGINWNIPSGDMILAHMLAEGHYEVDELDPLLEFVGRRRQVHSDPVVVEVGANVGTTTIPLCQRGYYVVAFEPVPRIRELLLENLQANGFTSSALVVADAITEEDSDVTIRLSDSGGSGLLEDDPSGVGARRGAEYLSGRLSKGAEETLEVRGRPLSCALDDLSVRLDHVVLAWSDTEAGETGVVLSGASLWKQGVPLWVEFWPVGLEEHGGLETFIDATSSFFSGFVSRDDLLRHRADAPIQTLDALMQTGMHATKELPEWWSTDVLLIPKSW
jgi:FkbM family methyltransferase